MLVIIFWLADIIFTLDTIPIAYYSDPPLTSATPVTHFLSPYGGSDPFIYIYFQPRSQSLVYSYVQVAYNSSPTSLTNYRNMDATFFDRSGYSMNKDQLILLQKGASLDNLSVTVFLVAQQSQHPFNLTYNLTVNTSAKAVCPSNCSQKGTCSLRGDCFCYNGNFGYDCSIIPSILQIGRDVVHDIHFKQYFYVLIPAGSLSSKVNLKALTHGQKCSVTMYFKLQSASNELVNPFSNSKMLQLDQDSGSYTSQIGPSIVNMWILLLNFNQRICQVSLELNQKSSVGILMIITIVIGAVILIALIIALVLMLKRRRQRARVDSIQRPRNAEQSKSLKAEDIDRYFPEVEAAILGVKQDPKQNTKDNLKENVSSDLSPMKDCVICLCPIEPANKVRVTYCNHIFHSDCLTGSLDLTQNCPYCRQNFDKVHSKQLYEQVVKYFKRKIILVSVAEEQLEGSRLAIQVSEYQKSKAFPGERLRTTEKIESTFISFEEYF